MPRISAIRPGPALLARNVALRHDFGFGHHDGELRSRMPWAVPRQDFQPGVPWHVIGLGAGPRHRARSFVAEAHRRRPAGGRAPAAVDRARRVCRQPDADERAPAARRGSRRHRRGHRARPAAADGAPAGWRLAERGGEAISTGGERFDAIADLLRLDGWRRRAIRWTIDEERERVPALFSLSELLMLGGGDAGHEPRCLGHERAAGVGVSVHAHDIPVELAAAGRPAPAGARRRRRSPDLNLQLALMLAEMRLPAVAREIGAGGGGAGLRRRRGADRSGRLVVALARARRACPVSASRTTWPRPPRSTACSCPTRLTTRNVDEARRHVAPTLAPRRFSSRAR